MSELQVGSEKHQGQWRQALTVPGISIILSVPAKREVVKMNEYHRKSTFKTEEHQCARYCFYKLLLLVSKVLSMEPRNSSMVQKFDTVSLQASPKMLCVIRLLCFSFFDLFLFVC